MPQYPPSRAGIGLSIRLQTAALDYAASLHLVCTVTLGGVFGLGGIVKPHGFHCSPEATKHSTPAAALVLETDTDLYLLRDYKACGHQRTVRIA